MLVVAVLFGAIGAVMRRALMRRFRFNPTGWLGALAALSIAVAIALYLGVTFDRGAYRATTLLVLAFVAFALMWLGALMLGREHIDVALIVVFCVGAFAILVAGSALFFVLAWGGAHGGLR